MSHQTFYRKYRSQTFDQMVGQDHIKQTLKNAIECDRLSHAYLFSGPRGTGKTSTARILAKSLNCRNGKSITPCLECDLCRGITQGLSVDVIEIDAASHTGVDNIRELNDRVNFMPVECRYKLYIIDEVHMLSSGAFNALLKTLEEPPLNTVFILATTEPQKIPMTIHSRCQHLYFRNLTLSEIKAHLQEIATTESIQIDDAALTILARNAEGCMRDGISLLDQVFSFKGASITYSDVVSILGSTEDTHLFDLLKKIGLRDQKGVLSTLIQLSHQGVNMSQLLSELITLLRQLVLVKVGLNEEIEVDGTRIGQLQALAQEMSLMHLNQALEHFAKTEMDLRWFTKPEILIQVRCLSLIESFTAPTIQVISTPSVKVSASIESPKTVSVSPSVAALPPQVNAVMSPPEPKSSESPAKTIVSPGPVSGTDAQKWLKVLQVLKENRNPLQSILLGSYVKSRQGGYIIIGLKQDFKFFREKLEEESQAKNLNSVISEIFGEPLKFSLTDKGAGSAPEASSPQGNGSLQKPETPTYAQPMNKIVELFEGTIL